MTFNSKIGLLLISCVIISIEGGHTNKILLKLNSGAGMSFIDLWNLSGISTGTESDSVFRSGILDNGFKQGCPARIYFKFYDPTESYTIQYRGTYTSNSLAWLLTTPYSIPDSVGINSVTLQLSRSENITFKMSRTADNMLYVAVYNPENSAAYPKFYHVLDETPLPGPIPGNENAFHSALNLEIKGRFEDSGGCDLVDHNGGLTQISDVLNKIQSNGQTIMTTTTESATTTTSTTEATTTTAEATTTTTEATTTTTEATTTTTEATTTTTEATTTTTEATTTEATTTTTEATTTDAETTVDTGTTPVIESTSNRLTTPVIDLSTSVSTATTTKTMCPCDCEYKKRLNTLSAVSDIPIEELKLQLAPIIKEIKQNLTVDVSKLSATIRKKQSAIDDRASAGQIGALGAVLLSVTFGMLVLIDITSIPRHLKLAKRNCCGSL